MQSSNAQSTKALTWRTLASLIGTAIAFWSLSPSANEIECRQATIAYPTQDETLANARPEIRWEPIEGADSYRVRLRSRVPEGEVLVSVDALAQGERFLPPRALTDYRAIVRVVVSSGCGSDAPQVETGTRFFIDTAPLCVLEGAELEESDNAVMVWKPVPRAIEYEAWFYEMPESNLAEKIITRDTRMDVPDKVKRPAVAAIRPRCTSGYGDLRLIDLN